MLRSIARAVGTVAAGTALGALGLAGAGVPGAAARAGQPRVPVSTAARAAVPGGQLWLKRYNGPGNGQDEAASVAVSPGGGKVFVTGASQGAGRDRDYLTVAYRAATGARLWTRRYDGPAGSEDAAHSVAVSPGGGMVFVTGFSLGADDVRRLLDDRLPRRYRRPAVDSALQRPR